MRIERRKFNHLIDKFRGRDQNLTWETIEKFWFDDDVEVTLNSGDKLITSPKMANLLRKRANTP